jgi:hypothetical protein
VKDQSKEKKNRKKTALLRATKSMKEYKRFEMKLCKKIFMQVNYLQGNFYAGKLNSYKEIFIRSLNIYEGIFMCELNIYKAVFYV